MQVGDKQCKRCGEVKPLEDFYANKSGRQGTRPECKTCTLAEKAWRHARNPGPARERTRKWQAENPERVRARNAEYAADGRKAAANRRSYLKRKYGITVEMYDDMLQAQGGVCAICLREPNPKISLHVDHDHDSGSIRGLTCFRCNQAMGAFGEDPVVLREAAAYLDEHDPEFAVQREQILERVRQIPPPIWKRSA